MIKTEELLETKEEKQEVEQVLFVARVTCDVCGSMWKLSEIPGGCNKCGNIKFSGSFVPQEKLQHPFRYKIKELWRALVN